MHNVVIVGSGCAGNTAAIYAARANLKPLVIAGHEAGGQLSLTTLVENFPGFPEGINGPDLVENMKVQAQNFGAEFIHGSVIDTDFSQRPFRLNIEGEWLETRTVIIASGASDSAMEEANFLSRFGSEVSLVHRREEFRASKIMLDRARHNPKIKFLLNTVVEDVYDASKKLVTGVRLRDTRTEKVWDQEVDGFFLAIGHIPNTKVFKGQIETD